MTCSNCGQPHDHWPDHYDGMLCQDCWEAECFRDWWPMVSQLQAADRRRRLYGRLVLAAKFLLPVLILGGWLWGLHHPNPCASVPEACRPAAGEVA